MGRYVRRRCSRINRGHFVMRHLIPFTKDQLQIIQASLQLSLKYADSQYIENVDEIMKEIENNTRFGH